MYVVPPQAVQATAYVSKGKKLGMFTAWVFCASFAVVGVALVITFVGLLLEGKPLRDALSALVMAAIFGGGGGFGVWKLLPWLRRLVDYTPRFGFVPPNIYGAPFDVRFINNGWRLSFIREGVVQFFPDHVIVDGKKNNPWLTMLVFCLIFFIPLAIFRIGLVLFPPFLLLVILVSVN